jgi:uncharacterized protein
VYCRGFEQAFRIDVSVPFGYDLDTRSYPVVYLIDGHWWFPLVSQAIRLIGMDGEMAPVIVVGIGYELPGVTAQELETRIANLRSRDLTPTFDGGDWRQRQGAEPLALGIETGHAEEFLRAIEESIKPLVRSHYRTTEDATLAGFSFGGLFALYVLFRHGALFDRYVAGSPSLWWDQCVMLDMEREYAESHGDLPTRLFVSMGERENTGLASDFNMTGNWEVLVARLKSRRYPSLQCESRVLADETHSTGAAAAFIRGLLSVFRK